MSDIVELAERLLHHAIPVIYRIDIQNGRQWPEFVCEDIVHLLDVPPPAATSSDWWPNLIHPMDREHALRAVARAVQKGGHNVEYRIRQAGGGYRWIEDHSRVVNDDQGNPCEMIGVLIDIEDRKRIEEEQVRRDERFREMLENVQLIAIILDLDAKVVFCNDYLLGLTGWNRDQVIGKNWFERFIPDSHCESLLPAFNAIHLGAIAAHYENPIKTRSGEIRTIFWNNIMLRDASGGITGVASIGEDVTTRNAATVGLRQSLEQTERQVEERTAALAEANSELQVAVKEADAANQAKSAFLSRMSHELRTPMNTILGFGQLLELSNLDDQQRSSLEHMMKSGRHLLNLINEVLDISRVEAGSPGLLPEPLLVTELLAECISLVTPLAAQRSVGLHLEPAPGICVTADLQRLRQVLLNVMSNAIKYNVSGGEVRARVVEKPGDVVSIEIEDTGLGISSEMQARLFTPFDRLGAGSSGIEGTGLGLSLSKAMIEAMGGAITFRSEEGVGSCFYIRLGKSTQQHRSAVDRAAAPMATGEDAASSKKTLLLIDDNSRNVELMASIFASRPGFELITAGQGRQGLELAAERKPDLILLDLHLPDMHGTEVLEQICGNPEIKGIPVIVVSADAFPSQVQRLLQGGAFRYVTKPFLLCELMQAVDAALALPRAA